MNSTAKDLTIEEFLDQNKHKDLLRFSTAGSVDDGKSTLIGRLLHDSKNIYDDTLEKVKKSSQNSNDGIDLALLTDGLKSEREQKITIDVAYRYFSTPKRNFILADTPGHEQYTRNMATGASTANTALILIDARKGVITQTKRHSFILSLLGLKNLCITINKMDLVDYSEEVFQKIKKDYLDFSSKLNIQNLRFIPISALKGDNVVNSSEKMSWFKGETVLEYLEGLYLEGDRNLIDLRIPIQNVLRPNQNFRGYTGPITSGVLRKDDTIVALPSMKEAKIKKITSFDGEKDIAFSPQAVTFELDREIDISSGDMIVHKNNIPHVKSAFESMIVWMSDEDMDSDKFYQLKHSTQYVKAKINMNFSINVNTLHKEKVKDLKLNEIGRCQIKTSRSLFFDYYKQNRLNGCFILIDPLTNNTVAAGMILDKITLREVKGVSNFSENELKELRNITKEDAGISSSERENAFDFQPQTFWLTGLSGSGKSTFARALEVEFFKQKRPVILLDGDNIRFGLNKDLGFSVQDRKENIRRISEVAKLFNSVGVTVITAFISPFSEDRTRAQEIIGQSLFKEIFVSTSLDVCEKRDPKGLYKKARNGEISEFTGVTSPYEKPQSPFLEIDLGEKSIEWGVEQVLNTLK